MKRHVAIIGSRKFPSPELVRAYVAAMPAECVLVSGAAEGVDTWAEEAANARGLKTKIFHADWDGLGRRAGPIRNEQIIAAADEVVAFWDGKSRGTLNAVCLAQEEGLAIAMYDEDGKPVSLVQALKVAKELGVIDALEKARNKAAD